MKNVIFVAPYFMDTTERFISAATHVSDAQIGLVSCDPISKLDARIRSRLVAHCRVEGIGTQQLLEGVTAIQRRLGTTDRILGMLEQIQVSLGEIRDHLGIEGMGAQSANNFRDKSVMKTVLRSAGLPCARHQLVSGTNEGISFAAETGFPVVVKPPAGAGAKGTFRCENKDQLADCLNSLYPSTHNPILLEEFITGEEHSFDSVMVNGTLVWHSISHYLPGPLEVVEQPWIQWCVLIPRITEGPRYEAIRKIAAPALTALGMKTGLSHMEWFRRPNGSIALSEVGARPPGAQIVTIMSQAHGANLYHAWAELMIHDRFHPPTRDYACGAAYLRGMGQGRVVNVHGLDQIARQFRDVIVEASIPKSGQTPSSSYEGDGYIIVRHPDTEIVERALHEIINGVQVELGDPQLV